MRALALLLLALSVHAQVIYEIRGTVVDTAGTPISGAAVTVSGVERTNVDVVTDAAGKFLAPLIGPGVYITSVRKDGYFPSMAPGTSPLIPLSLDSSRTQASITVTLVRAAEITGRLLDEESRQPIPNEHVYLLTRDWSRGRPRLSRGPFTVDVVTNSEGIFRFTNLPPQAEYLISPHEIPTVPGRYVPNATEDDARKTDAGYAMTYWPGGGSDAANAPAISLTGGFANIGNVYARKITQYRARITLGGCDGSARVTLIDRAAGDASPVGVFPCGSSILLKSLDPGEYALHAAPNPNTGKSIPDVLVWGEAQFTITDKNVDVTLPLTPGRVVEGTIVLPDGVRSLAVAPTIQLRPRDVFGVQLLEETYFRWDEDQQHFRLAVSPLEPRMNTLTFGNAHYVREIRMDGAPIRGNVLPATGGASKLELILDGRFASLNVTVLDGSRPAAGIVVLPSNPDAILVTSAVTGADGRASIARMLPGEYRLFAVPRERMNSINSSRDYERIWNAAPSVTLKPGETRQIEMRVTDLR